MTRIYNFVSQYLLIVNLVGVEATQKLLMFSRKKFIEKEWKRISKRLYKVVYSVYFP